MRDTLPNLDTPTFGMLIMCSHSFSTYLLKNLCVYGETCLIMVRRVSNCESLFFSKINTSTTVYWNHINKASNT